MPSLARLRARAMPPLSALSLLVLLAAVPAPGAAPRPTGRLVDLGGHRLHVDCRGTGRPTVVFENGLGDFSFDWTLVARDVARSTRVCTYDRAGYAWSDRGPMPRTFAQLNLELHDALARLGEEGPYVLVGHSFGGPVVRAFALRYPADVAGLVLVDSVHEDQRVAIGGRAVRLRDGARGRTIPEPREELRPGEGPDRRGLPHPSAAERELDPVYAPLPARIRRLRLWAQTSPDLEEAEASQREWSTEYFAAWHGAPNGSAGTLGSIPLLVLTRAKGGYSEGLDVPAAELDAERRSGQERLVGLSTRGRQLVLPTGHAMHLEAPKSVAAAVREVLGDHKAKPIKERSRRMTGGNGCIFLSRSGSPSAVVEGRSPCEPPGCFPSSSPPPSSPPSP